MESEKTQNDDSPLVLVIGISDCASSWICYYACKSGYRVRGTVNNLKLHENDLNALTKFCSGFKHELEIVVADLLHEDGWDDAVRDATYILHSECYNPGLNSNILDKVILTNHAISSILNVLQAISRMIILPKRVVMISSAAAMAYGYFSDQIVTDVSWTDLNNKKYHVPPFIEAITAAEKFAWDFIDKLPEDRRFEFVSINPSRLIGPLVPGMKNEPSDVLSKLLSGQLPGLVDLTLDFTYIDDLVKATFLAMLKPNINHKRFLLFNGNHINFREVSRIVVNEFSSFGYRPTTMNISNFFASMIPIFNPIIKSDILLIGDKRNYDNYLNTNVYKLLNLTLKNNINEMIVECCYSFIANGIVPDLTKDKSIIANYKPHDIEILELE